MGQCAHTSQKGRFKTSGGYGMYYHFDFVGGPVSYRWINVSQIERVWGTNESLINGESKTFGL
ncbi:MAG: glycosyl hydrolase 115 family protein [Saprospiraceae bacterium]|nr:glycosyl hydrolase 115 family protein [Saprospiraceae bacterium]